MKPEQEDALHEKFAAILGRDVVIDVPDHWHAHVSRLLQDISWLAERTHTRVRVLEVRRRDGLLYVHARAPDADKLAGRQLERIVSGARWASRNICEVCGERGYRGWGESRALCGKCEKMESGR